MRLIKWMWYNDVILRVGISRLGIKAELACRHCGCALGDGRKAFCCDSHKWAWHRQQGAIKKWRDSNREHVAEYNRQWAKENRPTNPNWRFGRAPWNKGLTKDDPRVEKTIKSLQEAAKEWREKPEAHKIMSENARKNARYGPANNKWRGGITSENQKIRTSSPEYKEWRLAVYKRDHFTCQKCGQKSKGPRSLVAHHLKSFAQYPELRFDVSNGITLCRPCHIMIDPWMGRYPRWWLMEGAKLDEVATQDSGDYEASLPETS